MAFPDPAKPIRTCKEADCTDCSVPGSIECHFRRSQLLHFLVISVPAFLVGGAGVLASGWIPLLIWVGIVMGFFGFIEIRVMCSHCPHYAEEGKALGCWANHGSPKLWKYRPGPMSTAENVVFFSGLVAAFGYPVSFLVINGLWFLLVVYALLVTGFFMTLRMFLCSQCMNFACPLNCVPESARDKFFEHNPSVAEAWNRKTD
jgi:hypothetical protein